MRIGARLEEPVILHGSFEPEKGKVMPYSGFLITDQACLYEPIHENFVREYDCSWWDKSPGLRTEWMPYDLGSTEQARDAIRRFEFPEKLIHEALRLSSRLAWCLTENARPRVQRRQAEGRFDPMASGRVLSAVRGGTYDPAGVRPFSTLSRSNPTRPHVGIMAAGNWAAMWDDNQYIPRVVTLTMAVAWACETLGCLCTSTLGRRVKKNAGDKEQLGLVYISKPGTAIPLKAYSAVMHREMYRVGGTLLRHSHIDHLRVRKGEERAASYLEGRGELSESADEEFNGVAWLKQQGATITISIGKFDDADQADVGLDSKVTLEAAIEQIAAKLEKQRAAA